MINRITARLAAYTPNTTGVKKESAVLIPLILWRDKWHLIFERRALTLSSQPGEICFPGGLVKPGENSQSAALRETCEELNLSCSEIDLIGQIDSIMTSFDMIIHCFVGIINIPYENIIPSESEVHELIPIPLEDLCKLAPETYSLYSKFDLAHDFPFDSIPNGKNYNFKNSNHPVVFYNYGEQVIWGLTARMLKNFLDLIEDTLK